MSQSSFLPGIEIYAKQDFPRIIVTTSINSEGKEVKRYVYAMQKGPIKQLGLSGGGAKGIALVGLIQAFEAHPSQDGKTAIQHLEKISGASIGAITAAFIGAGMSSQALKDSLDQMSDFDSLLGTANWGVGNKGLRRTGKGITDTVKTNVYQSVKFHLDNALSEHLKTYQDPEQREEFVSSFGKYRAAAEKLFEHFIHHPNEELDISFAMLAALRQLNPDIFKNIEMVAMRKDTNEAVYFNAENSPDLSIAIAARASASIPVVLEPVAIDSSLIISEQAKGSQGTILFMDGGYIKNVFAYEPDAHSFDEIHPHDYVSVVYNEVSMDEYGIQRTFEKHDPYEEIELSSTSLKERIKRNWLPILIEKINPKIQNTAIKLADLRKIASTLPQEHIALATGIGTMDFQGAKTQGPKIIEETKEKTSAYLKEYQDNQDGVIIADYFFKSPEELLLAMPLKELILLSTNENLDTLEISQEKLNRVTEFKKKFYIYMQDQDNNPESLEKALNLLTDLNQEKEIFFSYIEKRIGANLEKLPSELRKFIEQHRQDQKKKELFETEKKHVIASTNTMKSKITDPEKFYHLEQLREKVINSNNLDELLKIKNDFLNKPKMQHTTKAWNLAQIQEKVSDFTTNSTESFYSFLNKLVQEHPGYYHDIIHLLLKHAYDVDNNQSTTAYQREEKAILTYLLNQSINKQNAIVLDQVKRAVLDNIYAHKIALKHSKYSPNNEEGINGLRLAFKPALDRQKKIHLTELEQLISKTSNQTKKDSLIAIKNELDQSQSLTDLANAKNKLKQFKQENASLLSLNKVKKFLRSEIEKQTSKRTKENSTGRFIRFFQTLPQMQKPKQPQHHEPLKPIVDSEKVTSKPTASPHTETKVVESDSEVETTKPRPGR